MSPHLRNRLANAAPLAVAALAPYLLPLSDSGWALPGLLASLALLLGVAAALAFCPFERWSDWALVAPALAYLLSVAILRDAGGGNTSGVGPMVLLPVMWLALGSTRRVLAVVLLAVPLVYWLPIVIEGGARYPESGWRIGLLLAVLAATLGLTVQRLHDQVRAQAARLDQLAHEDELTGLPNRRAWLGHLERALAAAARRGEQVSVAFIDIDRFKVLNDRSGHDAGDALLVNAAGSWSARVRAGDVLGRMGGDEFALLLPACDAAEAEEVVDRMRLAPLPLTWSAGLATWDGDEPADALVRRADARMYEAKRAGRARLERLRVA